MRYLYKLYSYNIEADKYDQIGEFKSIKKLYDHISSNNLCSSSYGSIKYHVSRRMLFYCGKHLQTGGRGNRSLSILKEPLLLRAT